MLSTSKAAITAAFQRTAQRNIRLLSLEASSGNEPLFPQQKRGPWSHATGSSPANQGIFLDVHNTKLGKSAADGMIVRSLEQAIKIKKSGKAPTIETYNHLLRACAAAGLPNEARALLADMVLMKLKPTNETFSQIMNSERFSDTRSLYGVLDMMSEFDVSPDEAIYSILIERHAMEGQPEMCLRLLATMAENGISPDLTSMSRTISLLAKTGYPALATDLAIEFEDQGVRRLESTIWLGCLEGCTQAMNAESTQRCWDRLVRLRSVHPHEGLCMEVLTVAARFGLPELASDAIQILAKIDSSYKLQEEHFEPLLEACVRARRFEEGFGVVSRMQQRGLNVNRRTTRLLSETLAAESDRPSSEINEEFWRVENGWDILHHLSTDNEGTISPLVFNTILASALLRGQQGVPHALNLLSNDPGSSSPSSSRRTKPLQINYNVDTAEIILSSYGQSSTALSTRAMEILSLPGLQKHYTADTYEILISYHLSRGTTGHDAAFRCLRPMEEAGLSPSHALLTRMMNAFHEANDGRTRIVREKMKAKQHAMSGGKKEKLKEVELVIAGEDSAWPPPLQGGRE